MTIGNKPRPGVKWTVIAILVCTAVIVCVLVIVHLATPVNIFLHVREISFRTNSPELFNPANQTQLVVSGIASVRMRGTGVKLDVNASVPMQVNQLELEGDPLASCTFYGVRTSPIRLAKDSLLTLLWPAHAGNSAFAMKSHGSLSGIVTAQPSPQAKSGFACTRMLMNGRQISAIQGEFLHQDAVYFTTANDSQVDFRGPGSSDLGDTQISILDDIRFSHLELGSLEEKTVLLPATTGQINEISFEAANKNVKINDADLLLIRPDKGFYIRKLEVNRGIYLSLHGMVKDVLLGAGAKDLKSQMPSLFEEWNNKYHVGVGSVITAMLAFALGILEKSGKLPGRRRKSATGHRTRR